MKLPRDENNIPYDVRLKYWYTHERGRPVTYSIIASDASYTIDDLPSDILVGFSFTAMNKRKKKGSTTSYVFKTRKSSEPTLCYAVRIH